MAPKSEQLEPARILALAALPSQRRLIVLGPIDDRLSIASQQTRAINIAFAIGSSPDLGSKVCVIGGGIGGATLTSALLRLGHQVLLLERSGEVISLMEQAGHRWIHPNVLEWPGRQSAEPTAGLPMFDWYADDAETATKRWAAEWQETRAHFVNLGKLQVECFVKNAKPTSRSADVQVNFVDRNGKSRMESVDVCVLAVGYGTDRPTGPMENIGRSYWETCDLHRSDGTKQFGGRILVSGLGDGGHQDIFRASLDRFQMGDFFEREILPNVTSETIAAVRAAETLARAGKADEAASAYGAIRDDAIIAKLSAIRRRDTEVWVNARGPSMFHSNACPVNRFLLAQLCQTPNPPMYDRGELKTSKVKVVTDGIAVKIDGRDETYKRVVLRHGPHDGLNTMFPNLTKDLATLREGIAQATGGVDPLRQPQWPADGFAAHKWPKLDAAIRAATSRIQPPDRGAPFAPVPVRLAEVYVLPPSIARRATVVGTDGSRRFLRLAPISRWPVRPWYTVYEPEDGPDGAAG